MHVYYFPIVAKAPAAKHEPTDSNHNRRLYMGVTVRDTSNTQACDAIDFDYYHDWRFGFQGWDEVPECGYHIPYLWCIRDSAERYDSVHGQGSAAAYTGTIYFVNEPSLHDQCYETPEDVAAYYLSIREGFPNAQLVGPHVFGRQGIEYFKQYWDALVRVSGTTDHKLDGVGLHLYDSLAVDRDIINEYTAYLDSIGQSHAQIHITEFSVMQFDNNRNEPGALETFLDFLESNHRIHSVYYWANVRPCSRSEAWYDFPSTYLVDCNGEETMYLKTIQKWLAADR